MEYIDLQNPEFTSEFDHNKLFVKLHRSRNNYFKIEKSDFKKISQTILLILPKPFFLQKYHSFYQFVCLQTMYQQRYWVLFFLMF